MEEVSVDPVSFLSGWFFDTDLAEISNYDIRDFIAWSMFEGRHQEHLTSAELDQLEAFLAESEYRLSLHLYGEKLDGDDYDDDANDEQKTHDDLSEEPEWRRNLPKPKKSKWECDLCLLVTVSFRLLLTVAFHVQCFALQMSVMHKSPVSFPTCMKHTKCDTNR